MVEAAVIVMATGNELGNQGEKRRAKRRARAVVGRASRGAVAAATRKKAAGPALRSRVGVEAGGFLGFGHRQKHQQGHADAAGYGHHLDPYEEAVERAANGSAITDAGPRRMSSSASDSTAITRSIPSGHTAKSTVHA